MPLKWAFKLLGIIYLLCVGDPPAHNNLNKTIYIKLHLLTKNVKNNNERKDNTVWIRLNCTQQINLILIGVL